VGAIAVMLLWKPMRRAALIVTAVVVTAIVAGSNPLGGVQQVDTILARVSTVSASQQGDTDRRTTIWRTTPQIIVDHPVFGVGAKQFSTVAPSYGLVDPATNETFLHAHNIWLTIAAELGIIALAALIWWTVALIAVMTRACRRAPPSYRGLAFAVSAALVSIGVQGLVDYTVRSNVIAATMCALAALAVVLARSGDSGPTSPAARGS
jgi:putative inorganic carbon (HCO3(-)) transporter